MTYPDGTVIRNQDPKEKHFGGIWVSELTGGGAYHVQLEDVTLLLGPDTAQPYPNVKKA